MEENQRGHCARCSVPCGNGDCETCQFRDIPMDYEQGDNISLRKYLDIPQLSISQIDAPIILIVE